ARMNSRLEAKNHFLWVDEVAGRASRVRNGEILVTPVNGGATEGGKGLVHDLVGGALFSRGGIRKVFATIEPNACYKEFYKPMVIDSKLLSREDTEINFSMRWFKKALWITAVMEADYKANYFRRNEKSRYGFVRSTRIQDVMNYGQSSEYKLPPE